MNFNLSGEGSVRISAASSIRTSSQPNGIGCSSTKGYLQRSTEIDGLSLFISKKKKKSEPRFMLSAAIDQQWHRTYELCTPQGP